MNKRISDLLDKIVGRTVSELDSAIQKAKPSKAYMDWSSNTPDMRKPFHLIGSYRGQRHVLDTFDSMTQAMLAAQEYRRFYGIDWSIYTEGK